VRDRADAAEAQSPPSPTAATTHQERTP
jgi:hypothetical protein